MTIKIKLISSFKVFTYLKVATLVITVSRPVSWLSYKENILNLFSNAYSLIKLRNELYNVDSMCSLRSPADP